MDAQDRIDATTGDGRVDRVGRLSELDDYQVADGYPDIRGWDVKTADGRTVGEVKDLIVDTGAMRVRYLDVELDRTVGELARDAATPGDQERHTLIPVGAVRLDDAHDDVLADGYSVEQIAALPRYAGGAIGADYERSLRAHRLGDDTIGAAAVDYDHADFDDQRLFAGRRRERAGGGEAARLTLSEEQLDVQKRAVQAGEVGVRKTVETEHVRESVPVTHEEVTVERHPVSADAAAGAKIGEDEVRVPVMREEVVAEKRVVPREEIIVRKQATTEQRVVEGDVRRDRPA